MQEHLESDLNLDKQSCLDEIKGYFGNGGGENTSFLLIYSGHGTTPSEPNQGGDWMFRDEDILLEEVLELWKSSKGFQAHT